MVNQGAWKKGMDRKMAEKVELQKERQRYERVKIKSKLSRGRTGPQNKENESTGSNWSHVKWVEAIRRVTATRQTDGAVPNEALSVKLSRDDA